MVHRNALLMAIIILLAAGVVVYSFLSFAGSPLFSGTDAPLSSSGSSSSGSISEGDVTVDVQLLSKEKGQILFSIALNTHSVDLSQFDLQELITLEYGSNILKPVSVPKLSGHHASGTVRFEATGQAPNFIVRVQGIPQEMEREFRFS